MKNYLLTIAIVAILFGLVLYQSKPLIKTGIAMKSQNIDNLGIKMANVLESQFLEMSNDMTFHKKTISQSDKSVK